MTKEKISAQEIIDYLASKASISKRAAEDFLKVFISSIEEALLAGESVKIKNLGTFKLQWNEPRKSVNVQTGEGILLAGYYKVSFTPDAVLKNQVNEPFAHLEPVELDSVVEEVVLVEDLALVEDPASVKEVVLEDGLPEGEEELEPLRIFTEQASEIKNLLSEIQALSSNIQPAEPDDVEVSEEEEEEEDEDDEFEEALDEEEAEELEEIDEDIESVEENSAVLVETEKAEETEFALGSEPVDIEAQSEVEVVEVSGNLVDQTEPIVEKEVAFHDTLEDFAAETNNHTLEPEDYFTPEPEEVFVDEPKPAEIKPDTETSSIPSEVIPPKQPNYLEASTVEMTEDPVSVPIGIPASVYIPNQYMADIEPLKKRKTGLWILIAVLLLLGGISSLYYFYSPVNEWTNETLSTLFTPKMIPVPAKVILVAPKVADTTVVAEPVDSLQMLFDNPRDYTVFIASERIVAGTRLVRMAQRYYGSPDFWVYIYEANRERIPNPDIISPGTLIRIPKLDPRLIDASNPRCIQKALELHDLYVKKESGL